MNKIEKITIPSLKSQMTQIHRKRKDKLITNYYGNLDHHEFVYALWGVEAIVFWADDNGVIRIYFCAVSEEELVQLLKSAPEDGVFDYITRNQDEYRQLFEKAGWLKFASLKRSSAARRTPAQLTELQKAHEKFEEYLCCGNTARKALESDCDAIMSLLVNNMDAREMHLCSRETLLKYIQDESIAVYYEEGQLKGLFASVFKGNTIYSYLSFNSSHPGALSSMWLLSSRLNQKYEERIAPRKIRNIYCWTNEKNHSALRFIKHLKYEFDGLYDDMYDRKGKIEGRDSWRKYSD